NNAYLLTTGSGTIMNVGNFRSRDYYPLLEKLNIPKKSPHCTRHTFASLMAVAGARPEDLQKIIGHANYSTTAEIYIHADVEQLQKS
ncbi:MAG: tyrosine-type recombinase/integrase, partial [Ruthenibacterium sp.]